MKIAIVGGGPGGLYFAALMKQLDPAHEITVWERNAARDTFGFGVVFSDETLGGIGNADPRGGGLHGRRFARWTDIDIHFDGAETTVGGQGFAAMSRKELLRTAAAPVRLNSAWTSGSPPGPGRRGAARPSYDLVLAADGVNSAVRAAYAEDFGPSLDRARQQVHVAGHGPGLRGLPVLRQGDRVGHHADPRLPLLRRGLHVHRRDARGRLARRGLRRDRRERPSRPGVSDEYAVDRIREIFAEELDGHQVLANNSKWLNFTTVRNRSWHHGNVVLLGDAAHTAHFSIGSGTKLAMEDALALAACLHEHPAWRRRSPPTRRSAARWWNPPSAPPRPRWSGSRRSASTRTRSRTQFAFNLLTRSRRITQENLRLRDPEFAGRRGGCLCRFPGPARDCPGHVPAVPLGGLELKNRIIVSAMDMYSAVDGVPGDFHLVHLGSKALGGAGLVMTEMVCVSPEGRITPGCAGLYNDGQRDCLGLDRGLRAREFDGEDRRPAGPLRPQGLHQADVGGHRRAAGNRQLGDRWPLRAALRPCQSPARGD